MGARRPVIVSRSESASLIIMFVASSDLMFAVRYYKEKKGGWKLIFLIELEGGTGYLRGRDIRCGFQYGCPYPGIQ